MRVSIELKHIDKAKADIRKALMTQTNKLIKGSLEPLKFEIKMLTRTLMEKSDFFNELLFGYLSGHFGIPANEVSHTVSTIIDEIVENIEINYTNLSLHGSTVKGGMTIGIGRNGFASLMSLPEGSVNTEKGDTLPWLNWVLTKGDKIIVSEHDIKFSLGQGRSGFAIMIPNRVANWRVPAEFSGTSNDNVITRTILRNIEVYSRLVSRIVNKQIKSKLS